MRFPAGKHQNPLVRNLVRICIVGNANSRSPVLLYNQTLQVGPTIRVLTDFLATHTCHSVPNKDLGSHVCLPRVARHQCQSLFLPPSHGSELVSAVATTLTLQKRTHLRTPSWSSGRTDTSENLPSSCFTSFHFLINTFHLVPSINGLGSL